MRGHRPELEKDNPIAPEPYRRRRFSKTAQPPPKKRRSSMTRKPNTRTNAG